ncbi:MAG: hypothetical protein IBJ11_01135, partial [Phycisphaerales bacterium]|nr:hypothetical protein [Phycisphaerales bacterium]
MKRVIFTAGFGFLIWAGAAFAQVAVRGEVVHTMGPAGSIRDGVVVIEGGKITAVGPAASTAVPQGLRVLRAAVVTPGLVDCHGTIGLTGLYNSRHDSDQIERSSPMQPELRAIDAYNPQEPLISFVRSFGVTTVNTGHAPGELISGQTAIFKLTGNTVEEAVVRPMFAVAATLSPMAEKDGAKSPGTRGKMVAMLREELVKAREYAAKQARKAKGDEPGDADKRDDADANPRAAGGAVGGSGAGGRRG